MKRKKVNGILPNYTWLRENGYNGLCKMLDKYPEIFSYINRENKLTYIEEYVKIAEKLAEENEGVLRNSSWLKNNGYTNLCACMNKNKNLFSHITQMNLSGKTIEEHIKTAENLARENNSILPSSIWLRKNGHKDLDSCIMKNKDKFSHLIQDKIHKNLLETIKEAEELAKYNEGKIPSSLWLQRNGYSGLDQKIRKYSDEFSHMQQENKSGKTMEEYVEEAELLAKDNSGNLPCHSWLKNNGYENLSAALYRNPDIFKHINKNNKRKTIQEHLESAKKIKLNNNGIFPSHTWLRKEGYNGLSVCITRNKEQFKFLYED